MERRGQEGGLEEAQERREGAAWALSLALTWGNYVQDAMGMVLLLDTRVAQHPGRCCTFPGARIAPVVLNICPVVLQILFLLSDSLFSYISPSIS